MLAIDDQLAKIIETATRLHPPLAASAEHLGEMALEEVAGVLEVSLRVCRGGGEALKCCVEQSDDPPLLGERREREVKSKHFVHVRARHSRARTCLVDASRRLVCKQPVEKKVSIYHGGWLDRKNLGRAVALEVWCSCLVEIRP
jgi:hypothetical protein